MKIQAMALLFVCSCAAVRTPQLSKLESQEDTTEHIFTRDIHELTLRLHQNTLQDLYDKARDSNCQDKEMGHVHELTFISMQGSEVRTTLKLRDAALRIRGNTSCHQFRKQYKVELDENKVFERDDNYNKKDLSDEPTIKASVEAEDHDLYGLKSFSLRDGPNEETFIREIIAYKVYAYGASIPLMFDGNANPLKGGAGYNAGLVNLNIEKVYQGKTEHVNYGVYTLTENVDKTFLRWRFGKNVFDFPSHLLQGNLAKANLQAPDKPEHLDMRGYEADYIDGKKAKDEERTRAVVFELVQKLKEANSKEALNKLFDMDNVLRYMAASLLIGHWDSLMWGANNDFLFYNGVQGKWHIIPWDLDNTFGVDFGKNNVSASYKAVNNELVLFAKTMKFYQEDLRTLMCRYLDESQGVFHQGLIGKVTDLEAKMGDFKNPQPYGFSELKEFIAQRRDFLMDDLACGKQ